ncbi:hypothetical protein TESG_08542 [Trichophyton tonsurans CBS 112818]|uniref:Uncharacterized protein n=2 Tax=Trichophyton TaxID=5550 RepID=F2PX87_TRIEC|nr:hypothetical protein TESG_08542 [Trichophyton tonsurans CBS 112818]EGE06505.1 hypothetical protein TEQG_05505 [Trichophyton equinum CBS 127.97]
MALEQPAGRMYLNDVSERRSPSSGAVRGGALAGWRPRRGLLITLEVSYGASQTELSRRGSNEDKHRAMTLFDQRRRRPTRPQSLVELAWWWDGRQSQPACCCVDVNIFRGPQ